MWRERDERKTRASQDHHQKNEGKREGVRLSVRVREGGERMEMQSEGEWVCIN